MRLRAHARTLISETRKSRGRPLPQIACHFAKSVVSATRDIAHHGLRGRRPHQQQSVETKINWSSRLNVTSTPKAADHFAHNAPQSHAENAIGTRRHMDVNLPNSELRRAIASAILERQSSGQCVQLRFKPSHRKLPYHFDGQYYRFYLHVRPLIARPADRQPA